MSSERSPSAAQAGLPAGRADIAWRFDEFVLMPSTRELRRGDAPVALPARAFDCLAYLVENRQRAVGRDELIAAVWGRVEVSDALLGHTIVKIRRSLGDTGNEQRTIRTVPRFGYRWTLPVEVLSGVGDAPVVGADELLASTPATPPADSPARDAATAARRSRRLALAAVAIAAIVLAMVLAVVAASRVRERAGSLAGRDAAGLVVPAEETMAAPAMVLPADIDAPADAQWLRFGVMDLVASRLRAGAFPAMPSESVVSVLRQRAAAGGDDDVLHDPALAELAAHRILPRVSLAAGRWRVRLDLFGAQRTFEVEAIDDDAIVAARNAADELLRRLGRTPAAIADRPPGLDELLQRSGAAMLADQLAQARELIAAAPPTLQQHPSLEHRMAQIELRSGENDAAEARMHALLDRGGPALPEALRVRAMLTLAAAQVRSGRTALTGDLYDEAIALGTRLGDHEVLGVARLGRGTVYAQEGRYDEATSMLSRARTELAAVADGLGVASVDVSLGDFLLMQHRPAEALSQIEGAVRQFERLGAREARAYALASLVAAQLELGDGDAALATSERFEPVELQTNNQRARWILARARAEALAGAGRVAAAEAVLARIDAQSDPRRDAVVRAQAASAAARIAYGRGDLEAARTALARALAPPMREEDAIGWTRALLLRAQVELAAGDLAAATSTVTALRDAAAAAQDDWRRMYAAAAEASLAAAEGRREPALELFAKAMRTAERQNVPADLVAIGVPYLEQLVEAGRLDTAQVVSGRIAGWVAHEARGAAAQARLFRALGEEEAARAVEQAFARRGTQLPDGTAQPH